MTEKSEIVHHVIEQTEQDVIRWEYDHDNGYVAIAKAVEFRVICRRETNQFAVDGVWITVSRESVNAICQEIAKQSERIRTKKIFEQLEKAGFLKRTKHNP